MEGLGVDFRYLTSQVVNFLLLFALLYLLLYKRIFKMLDERSARIKKGLEDAEQARLARERAEQEYQERMEDVERAREATVAQGAQEGMKVREEILTQARQEAERIIAEARQEAERERQQVMAGLRKRMADLVVLATSKVIGQSLDEETHHRLIDEFLAEVKELE